MMKFLDKILNFKNIIDWFQSRFLSIVFAFILIIFYTKILNFIVNFLDKLFLKRISNLGLRSFLKSFLKFLVGLFLIINILSFLGVNLNSLFTLLGAISVAIGFSFKEVISNVFGGIIILLFKPFKVGDVIEYDKYAGNVVKIEIFYTRLSNFQNETVIIPNGLLITNELKNITSQNKRRLDLIIGVSYSSDISKTKEVLENIRKDCPFVLENETYNLGIIELAASSINFCLHVYVLPENYLQAKLYILEQVKLRFDENNIEIPFNQLDINVKGEKNEN